jgi:two-component system, NtrC family, nitrogen regulation response regulator NtrX
VVDDLPDWRKTLKGLLCEEGYDVQVADSRASALALLESGHIDLAVVDVRLDESDEENTEGLELATEIVSRWPAVRVVIITGYSTAETVRQAMQPDMYGRILVADYVEKSETEKLAQVVERVLAY